VSSAQPPEYLSVNRAAWAQKNAEYTDARARPNWDQPEITWGIWSIPESSLGVLPDIAGRDIIELGCGTAYFGAWLKRAGARRVVGIDITPAQLASARRVNEETGLGLEFIEGNAESVPLPDASFDLAVSEYGASIWCDPYLWLPEAARLLRPGGELVFLQNTPLSMLCMPDVGKIEERLLRPQLGMHRLEWKDDDPGIEFHLGHGELLRLLRRTGFEILDLVELFAPATAGDAGYDDYVPTEWAQRWPPEEIWRVRKESERRFAGE
jgi:SAM-dependent methyltransferase